MQAPPYDRRKWNRSVKRRLQNGELTAADAEQLFIKFKPHENDPTFKKARLANSPSVPAHDCRDEAPDHRGRQPAAHTQSHRNDPTTRTSDATDSQTVPAHDCWNEAPDQHGSQPAAALETSHTVILL